VVLQSNTLGGASLLPLTCLAPEIVEAILDGRQAKGLRLADVLGDGPRKRNEQRSAWGLAYIGLHDTGRGDDEVCDEFASDPVRMRQAVAAISRHHRLPAPTRTDRDEADHGVAEATAIGCAAKRVMPLLQGTRARGPRSRCSSKKASERFKDSACAFLLLSSSPMKPWIAPG
jgi:hypothetical protein